MFLGRAPSRPLDAIKKMIGIGLEGENVIFLRYAASQTRARFFQPISLETQMEFFGPKLLPKGGFQIIGPMEVTPESVDWLLYTLRFFQRRPLDPLALAEAFGPDADREVEIVVEPTPQSRRQDMCGSWRR
jgi:hypothetical protein